MSRKEPFFSFVNVTMRLHDRGMFHDSSWQFNRDEQWAILGPNGSGKSTLVRALWGATPLRAGRIVFHFADREAPMSPSRLKEAIGYVSFELHQRLMEYEARQEDLREFAGKENGFTSTREVLLSGVSANAHVPSRIESRLQRISEQLGIGALLENSITSLSTGEMRKALIGRALMKSPKLLVLDEPFDGLDEASRKSLGRTVNRLMSGRTRSILITHRLDEIVPNITHVLLVKNAEIRHQGPKGALLTSGKMSELYGCEVQVTRRRGRFLVAVGREKRNGNDVVPSSPDLLTRIPDPLIQLKDVQVKYNGLYALKKMTWSMRSGENWAILGPNGSGKSTILKLIMGDNPQAYANNVTVLGKKKGSGETVWEIKRNIGIVSSEFQIAYRKRMRAYDVIVSGFFDSVGLFRHPTAQQREVADRWIGLLDIGDIAKEEFDRLSYGQRRMILLARAMVKSPLLLILDEPCHGLDIVNQLRVLKTIEIIGQTRTQILYVTHRKEEILSCITHVMQLKKGRVLSQGKKEKVLS